MAIPDTPLTRQEQYLNAIATGENGGIPDTPYTRTEMYLDAIARNGGGGLPPVTSSDDGKVLAVENGAWAAAEDALVCTFTKSGDNISCDKSRTEILAAYDAGKQVYGKCNLYSLFGNNFVGTGIFRLVNVDETNNRHVTFACEYYLPGDSSAADRCATLYIRGTTFLSNYAWSAASVTDNTLYVDYTITGQPVDNSYPLSCSHTLAQIAAAQAAGREVLGRLVFNGIPLAAPAIVRAAASGKMIYSGVAFMAGMGWASMQIDHHIYDNVDSATLFLAVLNTTQIGYDSTTGTLYINNVPEVD